jgi:hypothetical protein
MSLGLIWLFIVMPLMVLGVLWSGDIPLWPPAASTSQTDFVLWCLLFAVSYGLPPLSLGLMLSARSARRG